MTRKNSFGNNINKLLQNPVFLIIIGSIIIVGVYFIFFNKSPKPTPVPTTPVPTTLVPTTPIPTTPIPTTQVPTTPEPAPKSDDTVYFNSSADVNFPILGLFSSDKNYVAVFIPSGNIEISGNGVVSFSLINKVKITPSSGCKLVLRNDGKLFMYDNTMTPIWSPQYSGKADRITMQTNGVLIIFDSANNVLWDSTNGPF